MHMHESTCGKLRRKIQGRILGSNKVSINEYIRPFPESRSWERKIKNEREC